MRVVGTPGHRRQGRLQVQRRGARCGAGRRDPCCTRRSPRSPSAVSTKSRRRSNLATAPVHRQLLGSAGDRTGAAPASGDERSWKITWKSGLRPRSRSGCSSSTSFSNGTSWWSNASERRAPHPAEQLAEGGPAAGVDPQHQRVDEEPDQALELAPGSVRDRAARRRRRPGRCSGAARRRTPASNVMNSVAPSCWDRRRSAATTTGGHVERHVVAVVAELPRAGAGRWGAPGRAGRRAARASRRSGGPARARPASRRCQWAKSAYWIGSGGSGLGLPAANAA